MKNVKELSGVSYDISDLQVMTVDGALVRITEQSGSLLFFHFLPAIPTKDEDKSILSKCVVELRMSKNVLKKIIYDLFENISAFESEKQENKSKTLTQKDVPTEMFA